MFKLYKLTNNTGKEISLLGTMHNLKLEYFPQKVIELIMNHKHLVTENTNVLDPVTVEQLEKYNFLANQNESVFSSLTNEQATELRTIANKVLEFKNSLNINLNDMNATGLYHLLQQGSYADGMDCTIINNFRKSGKPISGLEKRDDVAYYFEQKGVEELKNELNMLISDKKANKDFVTLLDKFYMYNNHLIEYPSNDLIKELTERNKSWLDKILNMPEEAIACVGSYHLYESYGLLNLISAKGYVVEQIDDSGEFRTINESNFFLTQSTTQLQSDFVFNYIEKNYDTELFNKFSTLANDTDNIERNAFDVAFDFFNSMANDSVDLSCPINGESSLSDVDLI